MDRRDNTPCPNWWHPEPRNNPFAEPYEDTANEAHIVRGEN